MNNGMVTLHVDLPYTDIEDFIYHFEHDIRHWPEMFIDGIGEPWSHFGERLKNILREQEGLPPEAPEDLPREPFIQWGHEKPDPNFDSSKYVRIDIVRVWKRSKVERPEECYQVSLEGQHIFMLNIFRYRRDRLRILIIESEDPPVHTPKILTWLKRGWGDGDDGVIELDARNAPPTELPYSMPTPDNILAYMDGLGYTALMTEWWDIYLDWVFSYRAKNRPKALTIAKAASLSAVSLRDFQRKIGEWEKRTGRERDTR